MLNIGNVDGGAGQYRGYLGHGHQDKARILNGKEVM